MWQQLFLGFLGFFAGVVIAGGVVGLLIGLSITPRYAGITRTADQILLYEDVTLLGTVLGNIWFLFSLPIPLGKPFLLFFGIFSGIFLGGWILSLAEMADIFPIFTRRIHFTQGLPLVILFVALGKAIGSFLFYFLGFFSP